MKNIQNVAQNVFCKNVFTFFENTTNAEESAASLHNWRARIELETLQKQQELQIFAYPESKKFPFATFSLLFLAGGVTSSIQFLRSRAHTKQDDSKNLNFTTLADKIALCGIDFHPESLLFSSFWRDDPMPVGVMHAACFGLAGTIIEKLHGPVALLSLALGGTVLTNLTLYKTLKKFYSKLISN